MARGVELFSDTEDDKPIPLEGDSSEEQREWAEDDYEPDPEPEHERETITSRVKKSVKPSKRSPAKKVSAAERKDVQGKVAFILTLGGGVWQSRDPHCGGVFVEASPAISDSLAEIICGSPEMLAWFTSGGSFMKYAGLLAALQPVFSAVFAHHITHSIDAPDTSDVTGQDWSAYGAPNLR